MHIASVERYMETLETDIDVFIHCAGVNHPNVLGALTLEDFLLTQQINTTAFFQIISYLTPGFKKNGGFVLGVSSIYSVISRVGRLAYATSKHALNGALKTVALELGQYNVLVNTLSPGFVDTDLTRQNNSFETIAMLREKIAVKRLALPEDIANIAYFLCSEKNRYITGQNIVADGGYSVGGFES